jgi:hypothetical protein
MTCCPAVWLDGVKLCMSANVTCELKQTTLQPLYKVLCSNLELLTWLLEMQPDAANDYSKYLSIGKNQQMDVYKYGLSE